MSVLVFNVPCLGLFGRELSLRSVGSPGFIRKSADSMLKPPRVLGEFNLLIDFTECYESLNDMNDNVKIKLPMFSLGWFTSLSNPFQTLPGFTSRRYLSLE